MSKRFSSKSNAARNAKQTLGDAAVKGTDFFLHTEDDTGLWWWVPAIVPGVEDNAPVADKPKADKPKADKPKADKTKADKPFPIPGSNTEALLGLFGKGVTRPEAQVLLGVGSVYFGRMLGNLRKAGFDIQRRQTEAGSLYKIEVK